MEVFIWIRMNLALNNPQRLICHKIQRNKQTNKSRPSSSSSSSSSRAVVTDFLISLSPIVHIIHSSRASSLHSASLKRCCRYVLLGYPKLTCPCAGVYWRTSMIISFLILWQCPACLVCLTWMVLEMGSKWLLYSSCLFDFLLHCCIQRWISERIQWLLYRLYGVRTLL